METVSEYYEKKKNADGSQKIIEKEIGEQEPKKDDTKEKLEKGLQKVTTVVSAIPHFAQVGLGTALAGLIASGQNGKDK